MIRTRLLISTSFIALAAALPAYGQSDYYRSSPPPEYYRSPPPRPEYAPAPNYQPMRGVVEGIDYVPHASAPSGTGAVVGGIAGGLLGHQIGSGRGNTAATIAGAIGGAVVGNQIQNRARRADEDYRVSVRLHDGSYVSVITHDYPRVQVGDRVVVENGNVYPD